MTLRVLLQKLHGVAAQLGADTQVNVSGYNGRKFIYDVVIRDTKKAKQVFVEIGMEYEKTPRTRGEYHRGAVKDRYTMLRQVALCYTCKGELRDSPTAQCPSCREKRKIRDKSRRYRLAAGS